MVLKSKMIRKMLENGGSFKIALTSQWSNIQSKYLASN